MLVDREQRAEAIRNQDQRRLCGIPDNAAMLTYPPLTQNLEDALDGDPCKRRRLAGREIGCDVLRDGRKLLHPSIVHVRV